MKEINKEVYTKSSIILGLGEEEEELFKVFKDLRAVECDFLTLGQYLPPSKGHHYPLQEYITPQKFDYLKEKAYKLGFKGVKSGPYVRSSYLAHTFL